MKITAIKSHLTRSPAIAALAALALAACLPSASAVPVTWTSTSDGDWSDGTNWDTATAPATSGDDIIFQALSGSSVISTVDSTWATSGSVNSLTFEPDSSAFSYTLDTGSNTLGIGAGGISNNRVSTWTSGVGDVTLTGNIETLADQAWYAGSSNWNSALLKVNANLSGSGNIDITGSNGGAVFFQAGDSSAYTGAFSLTTGGIRLFGNDQLDRLGSNTLTWNSDANTSVSTVLSGADQALTLNTPIHFADTGTGTRLFLVEGSATGDSSLAITGDWSGNMNDNMRFIAPSNQSLLVRFQQDGSTLTSIKGNGSQDNSALYLSAGEYSIENANALGAGNSLSMSLGSGGATSNSSATASLYATDGISVASDLFANRNYRSTTDNAVSPVVTIGVREDNTSATFSGKLRLEGSSYNASVAEFNKNRESNVHLQATSGSTVTFSGDITDFNTGDGTRYVPVIAQGGGTVIFSGTANTYRGGTSVIQGTTLVANGSGSSTGLGNVQVGYGSASVTGDTTSGKAFITGIADTSNLKVGQAVSGAGIAAGTIITYIHPTIAGRIEISNNATATASGVSIAAAAETGVLGGSGVIKPGAYAEAGDNVTIVEHSINVANGSSVAPGNSIGTLTLDGADTTAALLTMDTGSFFDFELDASGGTPDQLHFWNYVAGDLVLNNNTLNVSLSGVETAGEYTVSLFEFYNDAGSTIIGSGLTDGLVLNLGEGIGSGSLDYNGGTGSIDLTYTVVPEPSMFALAGLVFVSTLLIRRRKLSQ